MIKINRFKSLMFLVAASFSIQAVAADYSSNDDVVKEIEKTLLFDKESRSKIDVYQKKKSVKKSDYNLTAGADDKDPKSSDDIQIVVVDTKSENFDLREKEKLAYNAALVGQYEVATQLYKEVIAAEPNNTYSKFALAVNYQKLGQLRQSKVLYRDLLKNNPDNQEEIIGNLLAILIEESPKDASYLLSRLTVQNPDSGYILAQAALSYDKNKHYDQAMSLLERAIIIEPNNIGYKYNLAVIYDKTSHKEKAIDMYAAVEDMYSADNPVVPIEQIQKRLQSLTNKI